MNTDRELETRISAWLEEEATGSLPDWALRETFERTQALHQERGLRTRIAARLPWSTHHDGPRARGRLDMFASIAIATVVLVGIVGGGLYLSGAQDPSMGPGGGPGPATEPGEWIVFEHFGQAPDGSTTEMDFDRRQIWLVKPDGSELHELAPGQPADGKVSPDVSPDGSRVVFSTWSPRSLIYEVGIDGGEPRLLSTDWCDGLVDGCQEWGPAYSPDGSRIAFVRHECGSANGPSCIGTGKTRIGIRELATGEVAWLEETRTPEDEGWLDQPTWSPDGTEIAYYRANVPANDGEYPRPTSVWIAETDGSGLRQLPTPGVAADPDWSPDGSRIVYSTVGFRESEGGPSGTPKDEIWTIAPDGTDAQMICDGNLGGGCWAPTWMPGGAEILHWGNQTFDLMAPDGSDKRHVDPEGGLRWYGDQLGYGYSAVWQPQLVTDTDGS